MNENNSRYFPGNGQKKGLKFLQPQQIEMIDEALSTLDEFGEVRLIVEKGRLRFVVTQRSFDAHKWKPGTLGKDQAGDNGEQA